MTNEPIECWPPVFLRWPDSTNPGLLKTLSGALQERAGAKPVFVPYPDGASPLAELLLFEIRRGGQRVEVIGDNARRTFTVTGVRWGLDEYPHVAVDLDAA